MTSLSVSNGNNNGNHNKNDEDEEAMDIARDLDGKPLDTVWIQNQIIEEEDEDDIKLIGYSVPEWDAVRGMMSNGCRIHLHWNKTTTKLPKSVFYKRVVMADLHHAQNKLQTAPHKLKRDVKSYQVETAFLSSHACQVGLRTHAGVYVPKVYAADLRPSLGSNDPAEQLNSKFAMLVQDFSTQKGWTQQWLLKEESAQAALEALAKFHAYFWNGSNFWKSTNDSNLLEGMVWENGGYMQPALQGYEQLENVDSAWKNKRYPIFEQYLNKEELNVDWKNIGQRLQNIAKQVGDKAHPFSSQNRKKEFGRYRTLIHGDPKHANLFFRQTTSNKNIEVGLIDFQWCGFGLCGTDVAHFMAAAVQPSCISKEKETLLLQQYYTTLSQELVKHGVASSIQQVEESIFPRKTFQTHYETALLDICRMVFVYAWDRWKEETHPTPASFNRNAYNKSLPNAIWLIVQCCKLLPTMEEDDTNTTTIPTNEK